MKSNIPARCGGIFLGDRKIKCLQVLDWWVAYLTMRGKYIYLNNFKSYVLSDVIEDPQLEFEDTRYGKRELSNPKYFLHKIWTQ